MWSVCLQVWSVRFPSWFMEVVVLFYEFLKLQDTTNSYSYAGFQLSVILANHNRRPQSSEPITTQSGYLELTQSAGKRVWTNQDGLYSWLDERVSRDSVMQNQLHSSKNCSIMKKGYFLKILPCSGDPRRDTARALLQLTQRKCAMLLEVSSPVTGCCISLMLKSRIRWGEP